MDVTGAVVLVVVLLVATLVGLVLRSRSGRLRPSGDDGGAPAVAGPGWDLAGTEPDGRRALLLQLSSPVCAPCRQTARVLGDLAAADPGVAHVEVDVAERVDVARALGVRGTVVDQFGILASGVMRLVLGLAALAIAFVSVVVLYNLFRGQR